VAQAVLTDEELETQIEDLRGVREALLRDNVDVSAVDARLIVLLTDAQQRLNTIIPNEKDEQALAGQLDYLDMVNEGLRILQQPKAPMAPGKQEAGQVPSLTEAFAMGLQRILPKGSY
jgi:hypothetical protein